MYNLLAFLKQVGDDTVNKWKIFGWFDIAMTCIKQTTRGRER